MSAAPTEKQYAKLRMLGSGSAWVVGGRRDVEPLVRRGWVTGEPPSDDSRYWAWIRITPDGLRALALAVAKYGLPDLGPKVTVEHRECSDCGSRRYRYIQDEVDVPERAAA